MTRPRAPVEVLALAGALLVAPACQRRESAAVARTQGSSAPSAATSAPAALNTGAHAPPLASARTEDHPAGAATPLPGSCRVLDVKATKVAAPPNVRVGTRLTDFGWFDLGQGVELGVKHGDTLREFRLLGPGTFLACPDGDETVLVARGSVVTTAGPGARAGALVTLATPFGVVEYPDAELWLDVAEGGLAVNVKQGSASVVANAKPSAVEAESKLVRGPRGHSELHGKPNVTELVARCRDLESSLGPAAPAPHEAKDRSTWAVSIMKARRLARLTCAAAGAAAGRLAEPERSRMQDQLMGRKPVP